MVLNSISVPVKRKIIGVTLGLLGASQLPYIGPTLMDIMGKELVDPITVGVIVGAVGLVGAYLILARDI